MIFISVTRLRVCSWRHMPAFLWQARLLSEAWDCPWHVARGRHHFDVIDDLADPDSLLVDTLVGVV